LKIYHLSWPFWKHVENSIRGIKNAARLGYDAIDLDILITADGVIVVCHWMRPLVRDDFIDTLNRIHVRAQVRNLTWAEVQRLRSKDDDYRIIRVEAALRICARHKIIAYLEPKNDVRFELDWPWQHIVAVKERYGTRVWVRSIKDFPTFNAGRRRVRAAIRNGIPRRHTRLIRGS
jgi:glycerophosphoryl diester phosphodiesterase